MTKTIEITVTPDGQSCVETKGFVGSECRQASRFRCLYGEEIDLTQLGEISINRGSHVEPDSDGQWTADLSPVKGPVLGPFRSRSAALAAEQTWLLEHWLIPAIEPQTSTQKGTMISLPKQPQQKFPAGQVVITATAREQLDPDEVQQALARHLAGDWGDCCPEDGLANDLALLEEARIFSVYHTTAGQKFWIITEADRSATTVLLPEDY